MKWEIEIILLLSIATLCSKVVDAKSRVHRSLENCPEKMSQANRRCYWYGDPHYRSFDNFGTSHWINFQGNCLYVASETKPLFTDPLSKFRVLVENEHLGGRTDVSYTKKVVIEWRDSRVIFHKGICDFEVQGSPLQGAVIDCEAGGAAFANNKVEPVFSPVVCPGDLVMTFSSNDLGLQVCYDGNYKGAITVSRKYCNELQGICGNFNQVVLDDFETKSGTNVFGEPDRDNQIGNSWKVVGHPCSPDRCENGTLKDGEHITEEATLTCNILDKDNQRLQSLGDSNLQRCLNDFNIVFERNHKTCLFDISNAGLQGTENKRMACEHLAVTVSECEGLLDGNKIIWRAEIDCPLKCPLPYVYSISTPTCARTCQNPNPKCPQGTMEGCVCPPGKLKLGKDCVDPSNCQCMDNTMELYGPGTMWLSPDCSLKHTCNTNFQISSEKHVCPSDQRCERSGAAGRCVGGAPKVLGDIRNVPCRRGKFIGLCKEVRSCRKFFFPCPAVLCPNGLVCCLKRAKRKLCRVTGQRTTTRKGSVGNIATCSKGKFRGECKPISECKIPHRCWFPCPGIPCKKPNICCLPQKAKRKICKT